MIILYNDILEIIFDYKKSIENHELMLNQIKNKKKCNYIYLYPNSIRNGKLIIYNPIKKNLYFLHEGINNNTICYRNIVIDNWYQYIKRFQYLYETTF